MTIRTCMIPCIDVRVDGNAIYRQFTDYCDGRESKNFNFIYILNKIFYLN